MTFRVIYRKTILFLMAGLFVLTVILSGCDCGNKKPDTPDKHENVVVETNEYIVKDGKSDYSIVYPSEQASDANIQMAVAEFQTLFYEATNIRLSAYPDNVEYSTYNIFSIGQTNQAKTYKELMEFVKEHKLGKHGYVIRTFGKSLYMLGNGSNSLADLYSVYEYMKYQFDFECYARDEYKINRNVTNTKLLNFDVVDIPSFEARTPMNFESMVTSRLRSQSYTEGFNSVAGNEFCHNINSLIPGSKYYASHPKWFYKWTEDGHYTQELCLTAHGDENEWLALKNTIVEEMEWRLLAQPEVDWISFCQEDTATVCDCEACHRDESLYDTPQTCTYAIYIKMINAIARDLKAWNQEVCPERNIIVFLWDYGKLKNAPVKLDANKKPVQDENGNYMPYSEELTLEDNVGVYFCGFTMANFVGVDSQYNENDLKALNRVKAIMKNPLMYFWTYTATFGDYLMPYHVLDTRKEYYQFMKDSGAVGLLDLSQFDQETAPDFGALKAYVSAKLMWNLDENVEELIIDFFANYYKDAGDIMLEMYNAYRAYFYKLINENNCVGGFVAMQTTFKNAQYWPYMKLKSFLSYIDRAYAKIEPLKSSDPEMYNKLYKRIKKESLTFRYLELTLYPDSYPSDTILAMQEELRADCIDCGLTARAENYSIGTLFSY